MNKKKKKKKKKALGCPRSLGIRLPGQKVLLVSDFIKSSSQCWTFLISNVWFTVFLWKIRVMFPIVYLKNKGVSVFKFHQAAPGIPSYRGDPAKLCTQAGASRILPLPLGFGRVHPPVTCSSLLQTSLWAQQREQNPAEATFYKQTCCSLLV